MKRILTLLAFGGLMACSEDDLDLPTDEVIISSSGYASAPEQYGTIIDASIEGNVLTVEFGASGCSGDSWVWRLYDANEILESYPVQRNLKFSLENSELCQAYFTREVSFDISALRLNEYDTVLLNLRNYDDQLVYAY